MSMHAPKPLVTISGARAASALQARKALFQALLVPAGIAHRIHINLLAGKRSAVFLAIWLYFSVALGEAAPQRTPL